MSESQNFFGRIDNVILKEYDVTYPEKFRKEAELLRSVLPESKARFYHIGSTAVPDILSKPIIDIAIELELFPLNELGISEISGLGYHYWDSSPDKNHQFFFKNLPRTHHLHLYPKGYQKLYDQIKFRDELIADLNLRREYQNLKIKLAKKYYADREKYTDKKAGFVKRVLDSATG